jgi:hypothetical protein
MEHREKKEGRGREVPMLDVYLFSFFVLFVRCDSVRRARQGLTREKRNRKKNKREEKKREDNGGVTALFFLFILGGGDGDCVDGLRGSENKEQVVSYLSFSFGRNTHRCSCVRSRLDVSASSDVAAPSRLFFFEQCAVIHRGSQEEKKAYYKNSNKKKEQNERSHCSVHLCHTSSFL